MSKIYKNPETNKLSVKVPVTYQSWGEVELEFDSVEDMNEKLADKEFVAEMKLPEEPEYVEGSYEIDVDNLETELEDNE